MTFGQSLGIALIWQKLRGIEKNTEKTSPKPRAKLVERSSEGAPDFIVTAIVCALFALVIAFTVCLIFAAFTPAAIIALAFCGVILLACFKSVPE